MNTKLLRLSLAIAATLGLALPLAAQQQADYSKVQIRTTKIGDNLYALEGQGGAISVLTGSDGVFLVDTQYAPLTEKLVAAIRALSDRPIRFVVNTHVHGDHTGGNENFARLGATILARDQVRWRLAHPQAQANGTPSVAAPAAALPVITYDSPITLHVDNETVRLLPVLSAHTDGDSLVQFVNHDVLAVGDLFRTEGYPVADLNNGGSLKGLFAALDATIALAGPQTQIVSGHGPVSNRAGVVAQRELLATVRDRVARLVAQGKTQEEVLAARPTADLDAQVPLGASTSERFVKMLYSEIRDGR